MTREERIDFLVERARSQVHRGRVADADVVVPGGNPGCGDVVTISLRVDRGSDRIEELRFEGEGCTISQAAASVVAEMAQGEPLAEVEAMEYDRMIDALGRGVVQGRPRCATLALSTLKSAVRAYRAARLREESEVAASDRGGTPGARTGNGTAARRRAPACSHR